MPKLDDEDIGFDEEIYQQRMAKWAEDNGKYQQQQGDNARADAELVLKSQAQGHAQRMDISSILQKSTQQQPQQ
jgi:hypothetical protein